MAEAWPNLPRVSLLVDDLPLSVALAEWSRCAGRTAWALGDIGGKPARVEAVDVDAGVVLRRLAGSVGAGVVREGEGFLIVSADKAVESIALLSAAGRKPEEVATFIRSVAGDAKVDVVGDRVGVAGSRGAVERARKAAAIVSEGEDAWLVECRLIRCSERWLRAVGVAWTASANARIEAGGGGTTAGTVTPWVAGATARLILDAAATLRETESGAESLYSAPLYVIEGREASLSQGDAVPVPRRTVSDQGTVTTTGYDTIQTGFNAKVRARRQPEGAVLFEFDVELSAVTGYVDVAPIVARSKVNVAVPMESGGVVALAGLETSLATHERAGLPGGLGSRLTSREDRTRDESRVIFVAQAVRVRGGEVKP